MSGFTWTSFCSNFFGLSKIVELFSVDVVCFLCLMARNGAELAGAVLWLRICQLLEVSSLMW
jgi:hypothetical protein